MQVQQRLGQFNAAQLAELLQAMARLNMQVTKSWLAEWEVVTQAVMQQLDAPSLAAVAFALAKLQHQPQVSWLYGFVLQAYSKLDSFDSTQLGLVFDALPKLSHPGWLDEVRPSYLPVVFHPCESACVRCCTVSTRRSF